MSYKDKTRLTIQARSSNQQHNTARFNTLQKCSTSDRDIRLTPKPTLRLAAPGWPKRGERAAKPAAPGAPLRHLGEPEAPHGLWTPLDHRWQWRSHVMPTVGVIHSTKVNWNCCMLCFIWFWKLGLLHGIGNVLPCSANS